MSSIYISGNKNLAFLKVEPLPSGKAVMHTTLGPIEIELFCKEAPKACRNFIQLSLEGYYNNTLFHRLVPNFILQGGDPTESGEGGESIYGKPFESEFHSRLRFNRRGLLGMANFFENENNSQFFFTLGEAAELNKKNTMFGRVVGQSIYNLIKANDLETGADERPLFPPKIVKIEVFSHPFDDLIIRESEKKTKQDIKESKKIFKKDHSLLSFGDESKSDETIYKSAAEKERKKGKCLHDFVKNERYISKELDPIPNEKIEKKTEKNELPEKPQTIEKKGIETKDKSDLKDQISILKSEIKQLGTSSKSQQKFTKGKRKNEDQILLTLDRFKRKIGNAREHIEPVVEAVACSLHLVKGCLSCCSFESNQNDEDINDDSWIGHRLKFAHEPTKSRDDPSELVVIDPRKRESTKRH